MSNVAATTGAYTRRRVGNACRACRHRKVKCSGIAPCATCVNRGQRCVYDEAERRVVVLERHLRALERRAAATHNHAVPTANLGLSRDGASDAEGQDPLDPMLDGDIHPEHHISPAEAQYISHVNQSASNINAGDREKQDEEITQRAHASDTIVPVQDTEPTQRIDLPHPSIASFVREIYRILRPTCAIDSLKIDDLAPHYKVPQDKEGIEVSGNGLPSSNYILHLASVVDFHLNSSLYFFNHAAFLEQFKAAFPCSLQNTSKSWRVTLLLVIATGKLFLEKEQTASGPPGIKEFFQGVHALPSAIEQSQEPLAAVEALCLLAFYAQAVALHHSAYLYIGQAVRILRSRGLNRDRDSHVPGDIRDAQPNHVQRLYWTASALDQMTSATLGVGSDLRLDIPNAVTLASQLDSRDFSGSALRIKHSITAFSKQFTKSALSKSFNIDITDSVAMVSITNPLSAMQEISQQIDKLQPLCQARSISTISKEVATIHIYFCRCIIVAINPIMLHLVKLCLENVEPFVSAEASSQPAFRTFRTCVNAASLSLNIISVLHEQSLLEAFSFLGQETTFLAALSLLLANFVIPDVTDPAFLDAAQRVLQDMSYRGNESAGRFATELERLRALISSLSRSLRRNTHPFSVRKTSTMVQDGEALGDAILGVIEVHAATRNPTSGSERVSSSSSSIFVDNRRTSTALMEPPIPSPISGFVHPIAGPADNNLDRGNDIFLHDVDVMENPLTFDLGDLQWLDAVQ